MTTPSTPQPLPVENYWANFWNKIIQVFNTVGQDAAVTIGIYYEPWLGWPIIKTIFTQVVAFAGNFITKNSQMAFTAFVIDVQKNGQQSAVYKATAALELATQQGDQNAIQTSLAASKTAYDNALRNSGWATNIFS
jgi:hypothetical protein